MDYRSIFSASFFMRFRRNRASLKGVINRAFGQGGYEGAGNPVELGHYSVADDRDEALTKEKSNVPKDPHTY